MRMLGVLGFAALLLVPYLRTGFYFDDIPNQAIHGYLKIRNLGLNQFAFGQIGFWLKTSGRFFPLSNVVYYLWYILTDLSAYRYAQTAATLGCIGVFFATLRSLGVDRTRALLGCALTPLLFQIRNYHDPITSYMLFLQLSFSIGMLVILTLLRYLRTNKITWLAVSVLSFVTLLLLYEPGIIFLPVVFALVVTEKSSTRPGRNLALAAFLCLFLVYAAPTAGIRAHFGHVYPGTRMSFNSSCIFAFFYQASGALPFVYSALGGGWRPQLLAWHSLWIGGLAYFLYMRPLSRLPARLPSHPLAQSALPVQAKCLGWLLFLAPPLLVALSSKYQVEVDAPGKAYLPVFYAYFGVALLVSGKLSRRWSPCVAAALAFVAVYSFDSNLVAAQEMNRQHVAHRFLIEAAIRGGLLQGLPDGKLVLHDEGTNQLTAELAVQNGGPAVNFQRIELASGINPAWAGSAYFLHAEKRADGTSSVTLSAITSSAQALAFGKPRVFLENDHGK